MSFNFDTDNGSLGVFLDFDLHPKGQDYNYDLDEEYELRFYLKDAEINKLINSISSEILKKQSYNLINQTIEVCLHFYNKKAVSYPTIEILNNQQELYTDFTNGVSKDKYLKWQSEFLGIDLDTEQTL